MEHARLTNKNYSSILALFLYLEHYFTTTAIPHKKVLYAYLDKHDNVCSPSKSEQIVKPLYMIDPGEPRYAFAWKGTDFVLTVSNQDPHHLYKAVENPGVFEPMYEVEIVAVVGNPEDEPINDLLQASLHFFSQWEVQYSSKQEVLVYHWIDDYWDKLNSIPKRNLDTVYLPKDAREAVSKDLMHFLSEDTKAVYAKFGRPYHRTYCFHGLPGTGKTSLILSLISQIDKNIGVLSFSRKTDDQSFIRALNMMPKNTVLVLEDIDCLLGERQDKSTPITFSTLLNTLDGIQSKTGLLVFITTNYFLKLDPAFCRPGRIDYILEFKWTNKDQIFQMLRTFFPLQESSFTEFYEKIKTLKLTTCMLQKYFFERYPDTSILHKIQDLFDEAERGRLLSHHDKIYL